MRRVTYATAAVLCLVGTFVSLSAQGASAASNKAPIVIGMITDETGTGANAYGTSIPGAVARIDAQNAIGGVNGHKLQLVVEDDQSTPTGNQTAAEYLVADKGVFGVIENSGFTFGAAEYLNKQGIPVVGNGEDGPEWGQPPNSNMFSMIGTALTPYKGKLYTYNSDELKVLGVTRLAQLVVNLPSAISGAKSLFTGAKAYGISDCLEDIVPYGDVSFSTFALQMKKDKCNGLEVLSVTQQCIAAQTAVKQAGLNIPDICADGYSQDILDQPAALAAMQGVYTSVVINVLGKNISAPTKLYLSRLKKYTTWAGGIPTIDMDYAYESADLMIQGLEHAGANPSRKVFISTLRKISSYTAGGLIAPPGLNFTHFGTVGSLPKTQCSTLYQIKGHSYVPALHGKPVCGKLIEVPASGSG
jgi:branched-chain amino acid transport system substrate-binding protein